MRLFFTSFWSVFRSSVRVSILRFCFSSADVNFSFVALSSFPSVTFISWSVSSSPMVRCDRGSWCCFPLEGPPAGKTKGAARNSLSESPTLFRSLTYFSRSLRTWPWISIFSYQRKMRKHILPARLQMIFFPPHFFLYVARLKKLVIGSIKSTTKFLLK